jgi:hypothetical protein
MPHPSITLTARDLRDLLTPVIPFTDKGFTLPLLECVWLRGHGEYVTAVATDRYRLGVKRAKVTAPEFEAFLPRDTFKRVLEIFKPTQTHDPELTLVFEPERVTVNTTGGLGLLDASIGFPLYTAPDATKVFGSVLSVLRDAESAKLAPFNVALNPHFLADFRHIAARNEPVTIRGGQKKDGDTLGPLFISIGDDFRAALMPVRLESGNTTGLSGDWAALVADKPAPKPAARKRTKKAVA